jgi:hypothetical protein
MADPAPDVQDPLPCRGEAHLQHPLPVRLDGFQGIRGI